MRELTLIQTCSNILSTYWKKVSCKVGCIFAMVIVSEFRMWQYRDNDHREDVSQKTKKIVERGEQSEHLFGGLWSVDTVTVRHFLVTPMYRNWYPFRCSSRCYFESSKRFLPKIALRGSNKTGKDQKKIGSSGRWSRSSGQTCISFKSTKKHFSFARK